MEEGIILTIIAVFLVVIAGIIVAIFSFQIITDISTINFGFSCFVAFEQYNLINSIVSPLTYVASYFGLSQYYVSPEQAAQVQISCLQSSNIAFSSTSDVSSRLFADASSCFSLFHGATSGTGNSVISSSNMNQVFECYYGILSPSSGTSVDYGQLIRSLDNAYNNSYPLQIVFITNGTGGSAQYVNPSDLISNSSYLVSYFGYPSTNPPQDCTIPFQDQCILTSNYQQPVLDPAECYYGNQTVPETRSTVSSLSNGDPSKVVRNLSTGCTYYIPQCGYLTNAMVYKQSRVFVCITSK